MKRAELLERLYLRLPRVTALIGGGGKTTLLSALGETCARRGERVLLTTTTHLGWMPEAVCPDSVENLNRQLVPGRAVLAGLTVEEIGSLAARWSVLRRESDPGLNVTEEELENVKKNSAVTRENGCGGGC